MNNLDYYLRNASSISALKENILKFIRLGSGKLYNLHNPSELKLLIRLRLELSHLRADKLGHNFSDCLDELCICRTNIETKNHFLPSNVHYIYRKGKPLRRKSVILIKM